MNSDITNINFYELEKRIYKLVCEFGCEILKNVLENQDKEIMKNRDKKEYRHKGYKSNTIKTVMGEVEYKRAVYLKENKCWSAMIRISGLLCGQIEERLSKLCALGWNMQTL